MRVRIGIGDTSREVELDVPDADALIAEIENAFETEKPMLWFTDVKDRRVGVPAGAYRLRRGRGGAEGERRFCLRLKRAGARHRLSELKYRQPALRRRSASQRLRNRRRSSSAYPPQTPAS